MALALALGMVFGPLGDSIAQAHEEGGFKTCASTSHVYTKARYKNGSATSKIFYGNQSSTKVHAWQGDSWVNRYHQPAAGQPKYYSLTHTGDFSHVYSWAGCEG